MTATTIMERARPVIHTAMRPVGNFAVKSRGSVDPSRYPDEVFELFSIPAYDSRKPEVLHGSEIGSAKKVVAPGDVLISRIVPHIQRVWVVGPSNGYRQIASGEWIVFGHSETDPDYLRHMLLSKPFHDQFMQTVAGMGGSLLRARPSEVGRIEIPVPSSRTEQRRIAAILDKADAIRRKREQALTLADEFLRSGFLDMFGDLSKNDRQWPSMALRNHILHSNNGLSRRRKVSENVGQIVLRIQDIKANSIDFGQPNRIALDEKEMSRFELERGDVLFVRVNGNPDYVGRCTVFRGYSEPVCHNDHIIRLKLDDAYNPEFLSFLFNMDMGRQLLSNAIKTSAGQYTISQEGINELRMPCPPPALQQRFQKLVSVVTSQRQKLEAAHAESIDLFAALSQRAFAGDL